MGPYCEFCGTRCFCHMPKDTPAEAIAAYRPGISIIATCPAGQKYERQVTGWCYEKIIRAIQAAAENKPLRFTCAVCGEPAPAYRQWWNRDTGFGVCSRCYQVVCEKEGEPEAARLFGEAGVHHSIEGVTA